MLKETFLKPLAGAALLAGIGLGIGGVVSAQSAGITPTTTSSTQTTAPATDTGMKHHATLGGDGEVSAISGTTITLGEEADEGGATYTVDASNASVTGKDGATAKLSDIKVGDKIFVQGAVNGTSVTATSISLGHPGGKHIEDVNDTDGSGTQETTESSSSSETADQ